MLKQATVLSVMILAGCGESTALTVGEKARADYLGSYAATLTSTITLEGSTPDVKTVAQTLVVTQGESSEQIVFSDSCGFSGTVTSDTTFIVGATTCPTYTSGACVQDRQVTEGGGSKDGNNLTLQVSGPLTVDCGFAVLTGTWSNQYSAVKN